MASRTGLSRMAIQNIEKGKSEEPFAASRVAIAKAFITTQSLGEMEMRALIQELGVDYLAVQREIAAVLRMNDALIRGDYPHPDNSITTLVQQAIEMHGRARIQAVLAGLLVPNTTAAPAPRPAPAATSKAPPTTTTARSRRAG